MSEWAQAQKRANDRAEALLLEHLDEQQAVDWKCQNRFTVIAPSGNRYRVQRSESMVRCLDDHTAYCLQPTGTVPRADTALAHKLWLEADEEGFLKAANRFPSPNEWMPLLRRPVISWAEPSRQGVLHLETLEDARAWAESQNWDVTVTIESHNDMRIWLGPVSEPDPTYEVNDMTSDAQTVDLLRQVAIERNERHARAFEAGVERQQAIEDHLASLDCPIEVHVREGCCDVQP